MTEGRPRGRPRSEQARQAILRATAELLREDGYGRLTMEAIAARASVSKQTVYRWWPAKSAVVQEVLTEGAAAVAPVPDSGSLETDLRLLIRATAKAMTGQDAGLLGGLMAEAQLDDTFAESFRTGFLARRRAVLRGVLERGVVRQEVPAGTDLDLLVDIVFGVLWYRLLARPRSSGEPDAADLADAILALCR